MPADLHKARALFLHAVGKLPPEQWPGYVAEACGGDAELEQQVGHLLRVHREAGSFLDRPAAAVGAPGAFTPAPGQAAAPVRPREGAGTVIGPYKLLQQIGEGGMGTVWMAEQTQPVQRKVALKVIKAGMDSRQVIARFEAERQALALMDHPNIARVLDAGTTATGRPYFVMELVKGVPITHYCDEHHLTPRARLELFVPVCQAVQHAHQKGIIHRDLKPSNVLVCLYDDQPVPKVIDFGVAKATGPKLTEKTLFTEFGSVVGTLEYMSPEQAKLNQLDIDTRSDIYSLGVLLYELLTGTTPLERKRFQGAAFLEMLRLVREEEAPRPSTRLSTAEGLHAIAANRGSEPKKLSGLVRGELDWITLKALDKDRNRRYATASGFAADVQRYLADEPVQACPPSSLYRLRKFARRNKRILATAGVIAFALILGTAVSAWQATRATEAEGLARTRLAAETEAKNATREQLRLTEKAQAQATLRLYRSLVEQARANRLSRRIGQQVETLAILAKATRMARDMNLPETDFLKLRNEAIACLALTDLRIAKEWDGWPTGSLMVDFAANLERYARADRQGVVSVRRVADDGKICRLAGMGPGEATPIFSPDGQFLLLHRGNRAQVWNLTDPEPVLVQDESNCTWAFRPDSRQLARAQPDGSLHLFDLPSGRQVKRLALGIRATFLAFHPSKHQVALACTTGVQVRDLTTGGVLAQLPTPGNSYRLAWSPPDGKTLAVGEGDRIIHLWDVATRKPVARLEGKSSGVRFAFNHAGDLLASTCWDGILRLWDPRTGQQLFHTQAGVQSLRFSPDDQRLAVGIDGDKLRLWEIAPACGYRTLVRDPVRGRGEYHTCAISPKGPILAAAMTDGVGLWDLTSGRPLTFLPIGHVPSLVFEPSGALLTNGASMRRFSIQADPAALEVLRIGKARKLPFPGSIRRMASSADGRVVAEGQPWGALVGHPDQPEPPIRLAHWDVRYVAVSPDGGLVATGSHWGTKVNVWEARTGKPVRELPVEIASNVGFSPDGKGLFTTGGGGRLWAVDSWQAGPPIGPAGTFAFSPDGKLLAVETGYGGVRLVDPATGREYARLEDPNQDRANSIAFSPDGTQLVTTNNDSHSIHVWDLRTIRGQLARMKLDWNLLPYPPADDPKDAPPLRVQVDTGNLTAAVAPSMQQASDYNSRAWHSVADPVQAFELAQKAVELAPKEGYFWNTLGVAHYRAGHWTRAIKALNKSTDLLNGHMESFNTFFLAMAHWQLGEKAKARQWYVKAVQWMEQNKKALGKDKVHEEELRRFRAEATALLEVKAKKD